MAMLIADSNIKIRQPMIFKIRYVFLIFPVREIHWNDFPLDLKAPSATFLPRSRR